MFLSRRSDGYLDLSVELREQHDWNVGTLRQIEYLLDVVSLAIDPLSGLLAVGTPGCTSRNDVREMMLENRNCKWNYSHSWTTWCHCSIDSA